MSGKLAGQRVFQRSLRVAITPWLLSWLWGGLPVTAPLLAQPTAPPEAASWLDQDQPLNWNEPGQSLPSPQGAANEMMAMCESFLRSPSTPADEAVAEAGWRLTGPLQLFNDTVVVTAMSDDVDGMCRPFEFQVFVFQGDDFVGTLAPEPMASRFDGAMAEVWLDGEDTLRADYARYGSEDAFCCPSRRSSVSFEITDGQVVPGAVFTRDIID